MPSLRDLTARLPWHMKIGAKLVLSRLPLDYGIWRRVGWFRLGDMDNPEYAFAVVKRHFERANSSRKYEGPVALEIGPGDSVFSAMVAFAFGATTTYLIDTGRFAREDCEPYRGMAAYLEARGFDVPRLAELSTVEEVLGSCHGKYLTGGLASLRALPKESVDIVWSNHVLEHIRRCEFVDVMRELRRILRPDGVCSHSVDLKDNLSDALNNLRFSERVWESPFMASSGFYTNRLRYSEMMDIFRSTGFGVDVIDVTRWEKVAYPEREDVRRVQTLLG
jgi:SAM-dependent methyltransferase